MKKGAKIALWAAGSLLAVVVAAALAVGPVAKHYANGHGEQLLGRRLHIDGLRVNLFSGHVTIRDLDLYEDNGTDLFARFDTLDVRARLLPLLSHTVHIKHLTLAGLEANIVQNGDRFNFQSLVDHFASDDETEKDTTPSDWVLKFYNLRLSHARLRYQDGGQQWQLPDVNLRVPGFVIGSEEASEGGLNIAFTHGGTLNLTAHHDGGSDDFTLRASLDGFALKNIEPLLAGTLRTPALGGRLDVDLNAQGNVQRIMQTAIGGTLALGDVALASDGQQVASLASLLVDIGTINLEDNRFDLRRVALDGLAATYEQFTDGSTLDRILIPADTASPRPDTTAADTSAAKPLKLTIGELAVSNCHLTYADHTLPDPFRFPLTNINIEASDLTTTGENNARLRATLPGGGTLMARWNGDISHWKRHQNLALSIKGLDMRQLSPWTVYYTGQPVEDGVFGLTTRLRITHSALDNQNKIDIYKATVGSRRPDVEPQQKIPLKAALYILKDKDDKILIDLPVKGNIDSPEFNYMKLVWKTLGQLLVKVATSPVRALGNALGMGGDDLDFLPIDPAQRGLTSEQYHLLSDLATIAKSDSLVTITLHRQLPAPADDSAAFRHAMWDNVIRQYMREQGVAEGQLTITPGEAPADGSRTGYAITSEMKID